jgi:hypothetical protein
VEQQKHGLEQTAKGVSIDEVRIGHVDDFVLSASLQWPLPLGRQNLVRHRGSSKQLSYCTTKRFTVGARKYHVYEYDGQLYCHQLPGGCQLDSCLKRRELTYAHCRR